MVPALLRGWHFGQWLHAVHSDECVHSGPETSPLRHKDTQLHHLVT